MFNQTTTPWLLFFVYYIYVCVHTEATYHKYMANKLRLLIRQLEKMILNVSYCLFCSELYEYMYEFVCAWRHEAKINRFVYDKFSKMFHVSHLVLCSSDGGLVLSNIAATCIVSFSFVLYAFAHRICIPSHSFKIEWVEELVELERFYLVSVPSLFHSSSIRILCIKSVLRSRSDVKCNRFSFFYYRSMGLLCASIPLVCWFYWILNIVSICRFSVARSQFHHFRFSPYIVPIYSRQL